MLFHATGRFTVDASQIPDPTEETRVARGLVTNGTISNAYVHTDRSAVVLVLESATAESAAQVIGLLPFAADGTLAFDIVPIAPLFPDAA